MKWKAQPPQNSIVEEEEKRKTEATEGENGWEEMRNEYERRPFYDEHV